MQIIMGQLAAYCHVCTTERRSYTTPGAYVSRHGITYCAKCVPGAVKAAPVTVAVSREYAEAAAAKVAALVAENVAAMVQRRPGTTAGQWMDSVTETTLAQLKALDPRLWAAAGVGMTLAAENV